MGQYTYKYRQYLPPKSESRWASIDEIKQSNTTVDLTQSQYSASGIPLSREDDKVYVNNGDDHTLIYGSTGSKKTRTCVLPFVNMALHAGESVVCTDPKGEIYARTAGAAEKLGYQVVVLNFRDFSSGEGYNPLTAIWDAYHGGRKDEALEQMNDFIGSINASHKSARNVDPFWWQTASTFAMANLLFLVKTGSRKEANISSFCNLCFEENYEKLKGLSEMMDRSTIAGMSYRCIFGEPERTRQSTMASLTAMIQPFFSNRRLQNMMGETTFDMTGIGRKKTIVYLILSDEKSTYYFLATCFLKQLYETLIHEAQKEENLRLPIRVNYVLDEFGNIPQIPGFCNAIAAARSRNIRYILIAQSMLQLQEKYYETGASIIKANCNDWIFLNSKELSLLNEISQLCGYKNIRNGCVPLISVPELQHLKKGYTHIEALVLSGRNYPYMAMLPDIDQYEMFKTERFASQPPKKFDSFELLDFPKIYDEIMHGERRCPFLYAMEDSDDNELGEEYLNRILSLIARLERPSCTKELVMEAEEFADMIKDNSILESIEKIPGGKEVLEQLPCLIKKAQEKLQRDLDRILYEELEAKFDELFGSVIKNEED